MSKKLPVSTLKTLYFLGISLVFFQPVFGQEQIPVFRTKQDSVEYASLLKRLMKGPQPGSNFDSLSSARFQFLRDRVLRYRYTYRISRQFTPYETLSSLNDLSTVRNLSLHDYKGKKLPDSVFLCTNLEALEIVNTRIQKIPGKLGKLPNLKKLIVLNNKPSRKLKLAKNTLVDTLVIHGDELGKLPRSYRKLKNLTNLELTKNNLTEFPNLNGCTSLQRVLLNDNKLTLSDLGKKQPVSLEELVLQSNAIKTVPDAIGNFRGLKRLNLNVNQIETIEGGISNLQSLERLELYRNQLKSVPAALFELKNLRAIDLYFNQIQKIDPAWQQWGKLNTLYLSNNQLISLPDNIGMLRDLRYLYIHHNKLSSLPTTMGQLDSLKILRANENLLFELPVSMYQLKALENIDLSSNRFEILETSFFDYPKLKILALASNPWQKSFQPELNDLSEKLRKKGVIVHLATAPANP